MKTKTIFRTILASLLFLLMGLRSNAQTILKPSEITASSVSGFLATKGYKILEAKDNYVKLQKEGGEYFYIDIKKDSNYIIFNSAFNIIDNPDKDKLNNFLTEANKLHVVKVLYFAKDNNIEIRYYMFIDDGIALKSLENVANEFDLYIGDVLNDDKDKLIK